MLLKKVYELKSKSNLDDSRNIPSWLSIVALTATSIFLLGCEAPLVMDKVTSQLEEPLHRTDFYQAFAKNDKVAVLVGNNGVLLTSRDAVTWSRTILSGKPSLLDIDACPNQRLIALSFDNHIWVSNPDGEDWTAIKVDSPEQLMTIDCAPNGDWWTGGSFSTFLHSSDNGESWESKTLDEDAIITDIAFITDQNAVATAEFGMIVATQNGGDTWEITGFLPSEFYPHAAYFETTSKGWVGGLNGFIYYTEDGGNSWQQQVTDSSVPIYQFEEIDGSLFALGDNATVLNLNNDSWKTIQPASAPVYLRAALYFNQKLLVAGGRGTFIAIDPTYVALPIDETER